MMCTKKEKPVTEFPFYWFAVLEKAIGVGDFALAAKARAQLSRLGFKVSYKPAAIKLEAANA